MFDSLADNLYSMKDISDEYEYVGRNAARAIKHKEAKHGRRCEVCTYEFISSSEFKRHMILIHLISNTLNTKN